MAKSTPRALSTLVHVLVLIRLGDVNAGDPEASRGCLYGGTAGLHGAPRKRDATAFATGHGTGPVRECFRDTEEYSLLGEVSVAVLGRVDSARSSARGADTVERGR